MWLVTSKTLTVFANLLDAEQPSAQRIPAPPGAGNRGERCLTRHQGREVREPLARLGRVFRDLTQPAR